MLASAFRDCERSLWRGLRHLRGLPRCCIKGRRPRPGPRPRPSATGPSTSRNAQRHLRPASSQSGNWTNPSGTLRRQLYNGSFGSLPLSSTWRS
eukprot:4999426-Pyramimonas_sp.AAC.1